ncbi:MAG: KH domain-containing protein [Candidatus Parvarchaeota archaeon]|nr:KH domain-containing protein [Candidatus Parvarchaeota archaeon]
MEEQINITAIRAEKLEGQKKFIKAITDSGVSIKINKSIVTLSAESGFGILLAKNAVLAFNRGFDSKTSSLLLDDAYDLAIINVGDYSGSKNRQEELKGRIIGTRGLIKKRLSIATGCYIKVFGKTVSVIGPYQNINLAVEAIEMLLSGAKHNSVFSAIDRRKLENIELWK